MSNKVNDQLSETYVEEGINGGLLDSRANLFCVWKMQREGRGTVDEYVAENTLKLSKSVQLSDTLNTVLRRNDKLRQKVKELRFTLAHFDKEKALLQNEVKLTQQQLNAQYIRVAELNGQLKKQKSDAT